MSLRVRIEWSFVIVSGVQTRGSASGANGTSGVEVSNAGEAGEQDALGPPHFGWISLERYDVDDLFAAPHVRDQRGQRQLAK